MILRLYFNNIVVTFFVTFHKLDLPYLYLYLPKISELLVFAQNCTKLHQTSYKHKLDTFLSEMEHAENYHIWKP